jgi:hypothetical protein
MLIICLNEDGTQARFKVTAQDFVNRGVCSDLIHVYGQEEFVRFLENLGIDLGELEKLVTAIFDAGVANCSLSDKNVHQKVGEFYNTPDSKGLNPNKVASLLGRVHELGAEYGVIKPQTGC